MRHRRRQGPVGSLFALFVTVCVLVAIAEVNPPVTAPLAFVLLVFIVLSVVASRQARKAPRVARAPSVRRWHIVERKRGLAPCSNCGAPNKGDDFCGFCGTALTTSREVTGVSS